MNPLTNNSLHKHTHLHGQDSYGVVGILFDSCVHWAVEVVYTMLWFPNSHWSGRWVCEWQSMGEGVLVSVAMSLARSGETLYNRRGM